MRRISNVKQLREGRGQRSRLGTGEHLPTLVPTTRHTGGRAKWPAHGEQHSMSSRQPDRTLAKMIEGAQRYAAGDRSDPFTLRRALAHIASGVASPYTAQGQGAYYDATEASETRTLPDGREYQVTVYRSMVRP